MKYLFKIHAYSYVLLLTSCGGGYYSYSDGNWHPAIYKESRVVCPKDYVYNKYTDKCHYYKPPVPQFEAIKKEPIPNKPIKRKRLKKHINEPIDCVKAISKMKQCGIFI